jgi:hypothetical protein
MRPGLEGLRHAVSENRGIPVSAELRICIVLLFCFLQQAVQERYGQLLRSAKRTGTRESGVIRQEANEW